MTTHILTERLISPDERRDAIVVEAGLEAHEGAKTLLVEATRTLRSIGALGLVRCFRP